MYCVYIFTTVKHKTDHQSPALLRRLALYNQLVMDVKLATASKKIHPERAS